MGFYKGKRWQRVRDAVMRRDGYQCRDCRRYGRITPAVTVHHIVHLEDDPSLAYDMGNLISLCDKCHNRRHPEKGGRRY